jgi:SPW repeat
MMRVNEASKPPVRRDRRLRRNSVPLFVHGLVEYGAGALSILAPFLFSFDSDVATAVSILLGAGIIVLGFMTEAPTGVARNLPIASHVVIDYVLSLFLIVSPFIFGFSDDANATAYFIVIGVGFLLLTVATRYRRS